MFKLNIKLHFKTHTAQGENSNVCKKILKKFLIEFLPSSCLLQHQTHASIKATTKMNITTPINTKMDGPSKFCFEVESESNERRKNNKENNK